MKLEIVLVLVIGLLIYDTYYGGVIVKYWNAFKKYYKLAGIIFLIFSIYITVKKDPTHISKMFIQSMGNNFNKTHMNKNFTDLNGIFNNATELPNNTCSIPGNSVKPTTTKRSVSETKKKFVAYNQQWKCHHCKQMLTAWFEVDHVRRLDQGGSNDVSNLVALCRECHGQKTSIENM